MSALLLSLLLLLVCSSDSAKIGEACSTDQSCDAGLRCDACGDRAATCTQIKPLDPKSKGKDLPFNKYSWLTTHNSFAMTGESSSTGSILVAPTNQLDTVTAQLSNGVRGLMLDMYDFENDIWLCHSFGGNCYNFTAFQPAINVLKEVQAFLEKNPSEVVTIIIEDYVKSPNGLSKVFNAAGLTKYWFPVAQMPRNGGDWPLLSDMVKRNQRLLVFTSKKAKEATEGVAYQWNYMVENQYGVGGMKAGSCPNRAESSSMDATSKSLVLVNYFPDNPNVTEACKDNSGALVSMLNTCHNASGNRWANFIAVDFYTKSNGGGASEATDVANGHMVCGCDNIAYCKVNATFGTCEKPPQRRGSPPTNASTTNVKTPTPSTSDASMSASLFRWRQLLVTVAISMFLL